MEGIITDRAEHHHPSDGHHDLVGMRCCKRPHVARVSNIHAEAVEKPEPHYLFILMLKSNGHERRETEVVGGEEQGNHCCS
jgi:hypothetical protein